MKVTQDFGKIEGRSPGILPRHQGPADCIYHPMGEVAFTAAVVPGILAQERWIHARCKDAVGQTVGKPRTVSFAKSLRPLAIFRRAVERLIETRFDSYKAKSVWIEILGREFEFPARRQRRRVEPRIHHSVCGHHAEHSLLACRLGGGVSLLLSLALVRDGGLWAVLREADSWANHREDGQQQQYTQRAWKLPIGVAF